MVCQQSQGLSDVVLRISTLSRKIEPPFPQQRFHPMVNTVLDHSLVAVSSELPQVVKRTTPDVRLMSRHLVFYSSVAEGSSLLGYDVEMRVFRVHLAAILLLTDVVRSKCP
jgi:hypothetical protein